MSYLHVQRLTAIREEYMAVTVITDYAIRQWNTVHTDSIVILSRVKLSQIYTAQQNLSDTYIVRAFSEFEVILRQEVKARGYKVPQKAEPLVNRAALMSKVLNQVRLDAH